MLLAVDIGNTTISLGAIKKGKVKKIWLLPTAISKDTLKRRLRKTLTSIRRHDKKIEAVIICSVVPKTLGVLKPILYRSTGIRPIVVGRDIKVPIKNCYQKPQQVGQDRLVCAYAAMVLYGVPVIVIDFGTAITFDVVSSKKKYLGGAIIPGMRLSVESLFEKTALLPKVDLKERPTHVIGRNTQDSILSGIFYGYGALCDGMVKRVSNQIRPKPTVVMTGGYAPVVKNFVREAHIVDRDLIFNGLDLIYRKIYLSRMT